MIIESKPRIVDASITIERNDGTIEIHKLNSEEIIKKKNE